MGGRRTPPRPFRSRWECLGRLSRARRSDFGDIIVHHRHKRPDDRACDVRADLRMGLALCAATSLWTALCLLQIIQAAPDQRAGCRRVRPPAELKASLTGGLSAHIASDRLVFVALRFTGSPWPPPSLEADH